MKLIQRIRWTRRPLPARLPPGYTEYCIAVSVVSELKLFFFLRPTCAAHCHNNQVRVFSQRDCVQLAERIQWVRSQKVSSYWTYRPLNSPFSERPPYPYQSEQGSCRNKLHLSGHLTINESSFWIPLPPTGPSELCLRGSDRCRDKVR
jgi:hypothetical protein